jgi:hypothetical protein
MLKRYAPPYTTLNKVVQKYNRQSNLVALLNYQSLMLIYLLQKMHVIHWVRTDCYQSLDEAYEDGTNRLESLLSRLHCFNV